ncbi:TPA: TRAM domain-containing protein [Candidatus Woesearchaeota archaeon]|nr:TRAM domain-containing protein [Candidatus Woesearchaeota archaeon]HIH31784.1 TRAM domain-containing protein [Candidatus Woesearchaeota archaeon]HIH55336.1 TRAM domain-containing protein [Candidatus Woesearchaeota archaeon]HIJ01857.1 TRAM domain-containing protein [Candidatus Woesearchaeota archaeon]HIJ13816.1 TRAM domain-containing protein [Candidatus Woesearchaeota archaeon]
MDYGDRSERKFNRYGGGQRYFDGPRRQGFSPVKEGEELDAVIEAVAEKGDGIAKKAGFVIFVPGTKVGDKVKIRVKKVAKKVAFADVIGQSEATEAQPEETETQGPETQDTVEEQESYDASQDSEEF